MEIFSQEHHQPVREKRKQDSLDYGVSLDMALAIGAGPNTCFDNVLDMFRYFPDVFSVYGKLIEGWYVVDLEDEVAMNEHGWAELPGGKIIDPTVVLLIPDARPVYYFSGVERSWQEVKAIASKKDAWFPYVRGAGTYGEDGLGHPAYKAAFEAARQKVFDLAQRSNPSKSMTFLTAQDLDNDQRDRGAILEVFVFPDQDQEIQGL